MNQTIRTTEWCSRCGAEARRDDEGHITEWITEAPGPYCEHQLLPRGEAGPPGYPLNGPDHNRFGHHMEWGASGAWQYTRVRVSETDFPDGWDPLKKPPVPSKGWELNTDRWPQFEELKVGYRRISPGVLRDPRRGELIAHWRRRVT